jgi:acetoin utilization protein AcuB
MVPHPFTVSPSTPTLEAIAMMREHGVGCLPVVEGDQLVGIVTSYDFLDASAHLFQEHLRETTDSAETRTMAQSA